jgi:hypothetical protein
MQTRRDPAGERCDSIVGLFGGPAEVELMGLFKDSTELKAIKSHASQ